MSIYGFIVMGETFGPEGEHLLRGRLRVTREGVRQIEANKAPVRVYDIAGEAEVEGIDCKWSFTIPAKKFENGTVKNLAEYVPEGFIANDKAGGMIVDAVLGDFHQPGSVSIKDQDSWMDEQGAFYRGKPLSNFPLQIVSERHDQYNSLYYGLRSAFSAEPVYFEIAANLLHSGSHWAHLAGAKARIFDPVRMGMFLSSAWADTPEHERKKLSARRVREQITALTRVAEQMER